MKKRKNVITGLLSLVLLLGLAACGSQSNQDPSADPTDQPETSLVLCAGVTEEEIEEYANTLYRQCHERPEVLAAIMSGFPIAARAATGLDDVDALSLDYALSWSENGGTVQEQLLETLRALLAGSRTEIEVYLFTGEAETYNIVLGNEESAEEYDPRAAQLRIAQIECEELTILKITANYQNGEQETAYFSTDPYLRMMINS